MNTAAPSHTDSARPRRARSSYAHLGTNLSNLPLDIWNNMCQDTDMKRKQTYEQALAAEKNLAKGRAINKARAEERTNLTQTDEERIAFMEKFSTATLERRLASRYAHAKDKEAIREALRRREES